MRRPSYVGYYLIVYKWSLVNRMWFIETTGRNGRKKKKKQKGQPQLATH